MLELRNVTKIYHSKSGNDVRALDNVSVTFPETGMVFILGKSGSGKSTLLNVIGGLDGCDSGEFIIKGKSSKSFAGSDFDAYRNTFIGFIFQEYNILDEFTVGANIALALELQGKKATNEQINSILAQVEMLEYAKRKPNELSGGQKQRIAIARALVKDPEIIMADEPTGALDSNTGKQIFDTLKQLSKTKLVIIVSHDRDFAERYGDRIIEMMDGRIYTDVTKHEVQSKAVSHGILQMGNNLLKIEKGYQLTPDDVQLINEYLRTRETDVIVSGDARLNENVRNVAGISADNTTAVFNYTNPATDIPVRAYDGSKTSFIRSRLPMKNAVQMGASSLKHKVFRLVMTIFLSLIAFTLFGFADTMGSYDKITATTQSIKDNGIKSAAFSLGVKEERWYEGKLDETRYPEASFNQKDLENLTNKLSSLDIKFTPVYNGSQNIDKTISIREHMKSTMYIDSSAAYTATLSGFAEITRDELTSLGFDIVGKLPENDKEIAIPKFIYDQFKVTGFKSSVSGTSVEINAEDLNMENNGSSKSIIGQYIELNVGQNNYPYKITGVVDTKFDNAKYQKYIPDPSNHNTDQGSGEVDPMEMVALNELANTIKYGYHSLGYVTNSAILNMSEYMERYYNQSSMLGEDMYWNAGLSFPNNDGYRQYIGRVANSSVLSSLKGVTFFESGKTTLGKNEFIVSLEKISSYVDTYYDAHSEIKGVLSASPLIDSDGSYDIYSIIDSYAVSEYVKGLDSNTKEQAYQQLYPGNALPSDLDDFLIGYINGGNNIPGLSTKDEIFGAIFKKLVEAVFDIDFNEYPNITDELAYKMFYQQSQLFYQQFEANGDYYIYQDNFKEVFASLYAYNAVYTSGSTLHTDTAFLDTVVFWDSGKGDGGYNPVDDYNNNYTLEQKLESCARMYANFLKYTYDRTYNGMNAESFNQSANESFLRYCTTTISDEINQLFLTTTTYDNNGNEVVKDYRDYKIVGYFTPTDQSQELIVSDDFYNAWTKYRDDEGYSYYKYGTHENGIYAFVIAPMPENIDQIRKIVALGYERKGDTAFILQNQVTSNLEFYNEFIEMGSKIFIYVGLGFALFAAFMMMNFISTSISYKRREIGILRAVGARSSDVFKIFFSEALIIAAINYVLSTIATIAAVIVLNSMVRNVGINITLLSFGIRQVVLMLLISIVVAIVSSFFPVWSIARRKPVDAIKNT